MLTMRGITKAYGDVRDSRGIAFDVPAGRIIGLLGENGSGKTTLMNILFGIVPADAGTIVFRERVLADHTPREAIAAGISMIHQHFMLVLAMTVTENVMLASNDGGAWLRHHAVADRIKEASDAYSLHLDPSSGARGLPAASCSSFPTSAPATPRACLAFAASASPCARARCSPSRAWMAMARVSWPTSSRGRERPIRAACLSTARM